MRTEEKTLIVAGKAPELKNLTPYIEFRHEKNPYQNW